MTIDLALLPGDGSGPELLEAVEPLLFDLGDAYGFGVETTSYPWGATHYKRTGRVMAADALDQLADFDAILLAAFGDRDVDEARVSQQGHHKIRKDFDQYINLRPVCLFDGVESPLRGYEPGEIDIAWYRENSEGEYLDAGGRLERAGETEFAIQNAVFTKKGIERIATAAFEAALERERKVTSITKSNALPYGPAFWDEIVEEVATEYPTVDFEMLYADAANMDLALRPDEFDVVVSSNLFGDILTELAAAITGGLGLAPSANINPENELPNMFEPIHGTAPDIAGEGIVNPIATVLSVSLLLDDVGQTTAAEGLWQAVSEYLADPKAPRTPDIGGTARTEDVIDAISERL